MVKQFARVQQNRLQSRSTSQTLSFRPSCSKGIITIPLDKPTSFPRVSDLHRGYIVAAVRLLNNWGQPALLPFPVCTLYSVASHADVLRGSSRVPAPQAMYSEDPYTVTTKLEFLSMIHRCNEAANKHNGSVQTSQNKKKGDDQDKHTYGAFLCVWVNWSINAGAKCHTAYLCLADN